MFKCRSCESASVQSIIPLGMMPLANELLSTIKDKTQRRYNLEVMLCSNCGLPQLRDLVDPNELFTDYVYFSSNSVTMLNSAKELVDSIVPNLKENAFVVEIASNDGYLLKNYVNYGINALGIDPAENIAYFANKIGVPTQCAFFNFELANQLSAEGRQADIIHANNVMAHVPEINDFAAGISRLLKEDGRAIIEVPYFLNLVQNLEFDTIYHEHVYYFTVKSLRKLFTQHGLVMVDIQKLEIHGGSLRIYVGHDHVYTETAKVNTMLTIEDGYNLYDLKTFKSFMFQINELKNKLVSKLIALKSSGYKIAAYGASAKGTTLLNYFNIDNALLDFVVDKSTVKIGKYTPGTYLKIYAPSALIDKKVDYALLLAWNFAKEIMIEQEFFIDQGGEFILPLEEYELAI